MDERRYTLAQAGKLLGVSRERVRQLAGELGIGDARFVARLSRKDFAALQVRLASPKAPGRPRQRPASIDD